MRPGGDRGLLKVFEHLEGVSIVGSGDSHGLVLLDQHSVFCQVGNKVKEIRLDLLSFQLVLRVAKG